MFRNKLVLDFTAQLQGQGKLPKISDILLKLTRKKPQSDKIIFKSKQKEDSLLITFLNFDHFQLITKRTFSSHLTTQGQLWA